jgi:hypothetical protein
LDISIITQDVSRLPYRLANPPPDFTENDHC